ncbi:hypothetical protein RIF29_15088 [Crotalaria pallida]|uniref:Uncharacterized protein n=1 Tax=Crotalaria pallida TaxID=3830 RepID=A0AAN9FJF0_CROPI
MTNRIFGARGIIEEGAIWKVGNGTKVDIWKHKWIPSLPDGKPHSGTLVNSNCSLVSDLINPITHSWDRDTIYNLFDHYEAGHITRIQLRRSIQDDCLIWSFSNDGMYCVRSGYAIALDLLFPGSSSSSSNATQISWKKLWSAPAIPRTKELRWKQFIMHWSHVMKSKGFGLLLRWESAASLVKWPLATGFNQTSCRLATRKPRVWRVNKYGPFGVEEMRGTLMVTSRMSGMFLIMLVRSIAL